MDFEKFERYVLKHIKEYLPESNQDIAVVLDHKTSERDTKSSDLVVHYPGLEIGTSIHLDSAYMAYETAEDMDSIMKDIAKTIELAREELKTIKMRDMDNFEKVKNQLVLRVVNRDQNQSFFPKLVHRDIPDTDLAVIYQIQVVKEEPSLPGIKISWSMLNRWGIEEKELYQTALANMVNHNPFIIADWFQAAMEVRTTPGQIPDELGEGGLYLLSNEAMANGASVMLYPELLKNIGDRFGDNYFIIPSSIHELILLKDSGDLDRGFLNHVIQDINREHVAASSFLSDYVIYFDREQERFYQMETQEWTRGEVSSCSCDEEFEDELER